MEGSRLLRKCTHALTFLPGILKGEMDRLVPIVPNCWTDEPEESQAKEAAEAGKRGGLSLVERGRHVVESRRHRGL
jgi:hypothetical protein